MAENELALYGDAFTYGTDADGDPVIEDAQTGDVMFRWDRSEGAFIPASIGTAADPVPGTSHFENTEHNLVKTSQITNAQVIGVTNNTDIGIFGTGTDTSHNYTQTTLGNGETQSLKSKQAVVFLRVVDSGAQAGVSLYKDGGAKEAFIIWDPANAFSTTQGNGGTVNVYHDGSIYLLTNQTGNEIDVSIHQFA